MCLTSLVAEYVFPSARGASTKSGKGRRVRLTRRAVAALRDHRIRQLEERMRLAGLWQDQASCFPTSPAPRSTPRTSAIDP